MSIQIDNVKMWESIKQHSPNWVGNLIEASLKDQGLGFDEKGNIISMAEPKQEDSPILSNSFNTGKNDELTEFEKAVHTTSRMPCVTEQHIRNTAKWLMEIARKQIAEEMDRDSLGMSVLYQKENKCSGEKRRIYCQGIADVLKKIKEG